MPSKGISTADSNYRHCKYYLVLFLLSTMKSISTLCVFTSFREFFSWLDHNVLRFSTSELAWEVRRSFPFRSYEIVSTVVSDNHENRFFVITPVNKSESYGSGAMGPKVLKMTLFAVVCCCYCFSNISRNLRDVQRVHSGIFIKNSIFLNIRELYRKRPS